LGARSERGAEAVAGTDGLEAELEPLSPETAEAGAELQGMLYMLQHTLRCYDVQE